MNPVPFDLSTQDAVAWLRRLPPESIDLLITDPAYESLEKHRAIGTTTRLKHSKASSNDWFTIFPNARFGELFQAVFRVLKRNSHFYLLCDAETMFVARPAAEQAGFRFWKPLVWDKCTIGMGYHYRARYEFILFFEKGKRRLNDLGVPDIIAVPRIRGGYPAEKPADIADVLIRQSSEPGEVVADPFMGSGSVGVASVRLGRRFLGNDLNPEAVEIAGRRLRDATRPDGPAAASAPSERRPARKAGHRDGPAEAGRDDRPAEAGHEVRERAEEPDRGEPRQADLLGPLPARS